ncbi:hypothetical protein [Rickettsia endosymbiont of Cantharis rufa]|uniref:hypothetical protein n=1 Tax=Rickettsia endosymbiont of Cantharis rufa TaxID=3066248 RepID=UPI0031334466
MIHQLNSFLTTVTRITTIRKTIGDQEYNMLQIGYNGENYYINPTTKNLIVSNCPKNNMAAIECSKGIELLNSNIVDLIFRGLFKVKKALTVDEAIITAVNDNGDDVRDYILNKQGNKTFMYEESLIKMCQENFRYYSDVQNYTKILNPTIEHILNTAAANNHIIMGYSKGCEIFEVLKGNNLNGISSEIKNLIANPISNTTQSSVTSTTEGWTKSVTEYLSEMATNAVNNTITNSAAEISESIFSNNTESWTETGINLINNTVANLTNTSFNSTYNPQENMSDDSDTDTSLVAPYIKNGIAGITVIGVAIVAGLTWYVRNKNAKKAQLQKYIAEEEANRSEEPKASEDATENHSLLSGNTSDNDYTAVDMTGVSYEDGGTLV